MKLLRACALFATLMSVHLMAGLLAISLFIGGPANASGNGAITDTTVELPSGKVFYRDSGGKGAPIVLLHAGSGNSMLWEYQISAFTAAGYRFIAVDYRGVNPGSGANSFALLDELSNKLGLDKFHLLGTASGAGTALQYAVLHPDKVRSLIMANSVGNVQDKDYAELRLRLRPAPAFNQLPLDFRELGPSYRATNPDGVKRWLALSGSDVPPPTAPGGQGGGANPITWATLETLKVPTLLMTGDADLFTPPAVLRIFAAHLKQAETAVIADSGHSSYWESPDIFNRTVLAFISKH